MNSQRLKTEQAICKSLNGELGSKMREMGKIRVGMQGMRLKCGWGKSTWECGKSG